MNMLLKMTEIVISASLRPYIWPFWVYFLAFWELVIQNTSNGIYKLDNNLFWVYMDMQDFKMNILLTMTEIVILAPLKPYIWHVWVHFIALKTQNFRNGLSRTAKTAYYISYR